VTKLAKVGEAGFMPQSSLSRVEVTCFGRVQSVNTFF
jgi:hypothetical protein